MGSGYFFAIPVVDKISYVVDVRERAIDILPQNAITRDNVSVEVSGNLFVQFVDPEKAAYGARHPLYSVTQHAQSAMRSAIAQAWGLSVRRYEITEITPDKEIRTAMDKQAAAERDRREQVLRAEGDKRKAELSSEGTKIALTNESEGILIKIQNEAEAKKSQLVREAEGDAEAIKIKATAQAVAINKIAKELQNERGIDAAKLALAREYVDMYGLMGSKSNTMIFNDRPADLSSSVAQTATVLNSVNRNNCEKKNKQD